MEDDKVIDFNEYKDKSLELFDKMDDLLIQMNEISRNISIDLFSIERKLNKRLLDGISDIFSNIKHNLELLKNYPEQYEKMENRYQELWMKYQKLLGDKKTV